MQLKRASFVLNNGIKLELQTLVVDSLHNKIRNEFWLSGEDGQVIHFFPVDDWNCIGASKRREVFLQNCTKYCIGADTKNNEQKNQIQSVVHLWFDLLKLGSDLLTATNRSGQ
jgi:hypothetical protein